MEWTTRLHFYEIKTCLHIFLLSIATLFYGSVISSLIIWHGEERTIFSGLTVGNL